MRLQSLYICLISRTEVNYTGRGVREEVDEGEFKFGTSAEINNKQEIKVR